MNLEFKFISFQLEIFFYIQVKTRNLNADIFEDPDRLSLRRGTVNVLVMLERYKAAE